MTQRQAVVRTTHEDPQRIARAIRPDNTTEMTTQADDGVLETRIDRSTTGGVRTSIDDYLVNVIVAERTRTRLQTDRTTNHDTRSEYNE